MDLRKVKIKVENPTGNNLELSIHRDASLDEYKSMFKTILMFQTFSETSIRELFYEECDHTGVDVDDLIDIDILAEKFCACELPFSVSADACALTPGPNRIGTNLLSFEEAKTILKTILK